VLAQVLKRDAKEEPESQCLACPQNEGKLATSERGTGENSLGCLQLGGRQSSNADGVGSSLESYIVEIEQNIKMPAGVE
jgi:hypothetical protein